MKKTLKIIGIVIGSLLLALVGIYLYLTDFGQNNILSQGPGSPDIEIPITYNVGWWPYQSDIQINDFEINIIESNLNLFNSESLISYSISGKAVYKGSWKPFIEEVHISERINNDTTLKVQRIIEITPVVAVDKDDETVEESTVPFEFTNQHIITSGNWGSNNVLLICGEHEKIIELIQSK